MKTLKDVRQTEESYKYSDIDIYMNIEKNDVKLVKNYYSIYQSIWNILNTHKGEMPHAYDFGLDLYRLIFEQNTNTQKIKDYIISNIEYWEPRVEIIDVDITQGGLDNNAISLDFIFRIGTETIVQSYGIMVTE